MPLIKILRRLSRPASLDEIATANAQENDDITKAGTRAQLVRLMEINEVYQPKRGVYALKR